MKKRIEYGILLFALLMIYIWTNVKMTLWALIIAVGMMAVTVLLNFVISRVVKIKYDILQDDVGNNYISIILENRFILPSNHIESIIKCDNVVFGSSESKKIQLSVGGRSMEEFRIPMKSRYCGRIDLTVSKCRIYDWLDLTFRPVKIEKAGYCYEYPPNHPQVVDEVMSGVSQGDEMTYKHVKGNDVSEILQIREYVKGDSVKSIHWKISAKQGKMMIKELDTPNDNSIMLLFDYADISNKDTNNNIITAVCNISEELMKNRKGHTLYRIDTSKNRIVNRQIQEPEEFDIVQREILENEAKKTKKCVADYIMDEALYRKFAKVIYVRPRNYTDDSGIDELEQCSLVLID